MTRITPRLLFLIVFISPLLEAQSAYNNWMAVEQLPLGQPIEVFERGSYPTSCRIDMTDDTALACIISSPYAPLQRMVFPIADIAAIYVLERPKGAGRRGVLIVTAICSSVGGFTGSHAGAGPAAIGVAVGGLIGANIALESPRGRYPLPMSRRLIYRAP